MCVACGFTEDESVIELVYDAEMRTRKGWQDGKWVLTIEGRGLKVAYDKLCEGGRFSIRAIMPEDEKLAGVSSITIEPYPEPAGG